MSVVYTDNCAAIPKGKNPFFWFAHFLFVIQNVFQAAKRYLATMSNTAIFVIDRIASCIISLFMFFLYRHRAFRFAPYSRHQKSQAHARGNHLWRCSHFSNDNMQCHCSGRLVLYCSFDNSCFFGGFLFRGKIPLLKMIIQESRNEHMRRLYE